MGSVFKNSTAYSGGSRSIRSSRVSSVSYTPISSSASFWDYAMSGNYLYVAADVDGIVVLDISNVESPSVVTTTRLRDADGSVISTPVTDVIVVGTNLYACGRTINWTSGNITGYIAKYDITTPSAPSWTATYHPADMSPKPEVVSGYIGNNWYQGMSANSAGTYIAVASQFFGLTIIDPATMTVAATVEDAALQTALGSPSGMYWETSRCYWLGNYIYLANHGNGIIAVDATNPLAPSVVGWYDAPTYNSIQLRARDVVGDGNYIYTSNNTLTAVTQANDGRGLLVMNITTPTAVDVTDWIYCPIHADDVDTWIGTGDKPIMGISKLGNYVYLANGQRGTAVFYVLDPENPEYLGLIGTGTPSSTNLYKTFVFKIGPITYICYGDGKEGAVQKQNIYIDRLYH